MPLLWVIGGVLGLVALSLAFEIGVYKLNEATENEAFEYLKRVRKKKSELYEMLRANKDSLPEKARKNINQFLIEHE